ncbi:MAG: PadR family transcriptional regulator [Robiginitomaculum sp.]|nr:PadR family transcriptional regulator [Robiginitomaculum sp.]
MALAEAILVCLTDRPMSGYDLAKTFDASIGLFWRASHQQVYRELARLRERNLVESTEVEQRGKPNRIVHTITEAGEHTILQWSLKPCKMPSIKDELLVKFYALETVDIPALSEQLGVRIDQHRGKLNVYHRIKERFYDGHNLSTSQHGKLIALTMGISNETEVIQSLENALVMLQDTQD